MLFQQKLDTVVRKNNSLLCVGLDSDLQKLPKSLKGKRCPIFEFNKAIIDATYDLVCAYKPNSAFYEAEGAKGIEQLKMTMDYLHRKYPQVVTILDAKRADIGSTNEGYVKFVFDYLGVDAVTLHPYLGREAIQPFLDRKDKGCIILSRTSNPGAGEFQDLEIKGEPLYKIVAKKVVSSWNTNKNCLLVVGATYPQELAEVRAIAPDMTFLVPGVGAQGGDVQQILRAGLNSKRVGVIINASRSIIFAQTQAKETFAQASRREAKMLQDTINLYRIPAKPLNKTEKDLADALFDIGAVKFGAFRLKLHETNPTAPLSPFYVDLRVLRSFPEAKKKAINAYSKLLEGLKFDVLADVPTAATPLVSSLSDLIGKPMITPRMDKKGYGSGAVIDGAYKKGQKAVVIDDLVTKADSKVEAIKVLEEAGLKVTDVVVLVDREQGGRKQLKDSGYQLHRSVTINQIFDYLVEVGKITKEKYQEIQNYLRV